MTKIYDAFDKAFDQVSGFVILTKSGERAATVAFKFPKNGAGRISCYLHVLSTEMVKGTANGYGYDKPAAAFRKAVRNLEKITQEERQGEWMKGQGELIEALKAEDDAAGGGETWETLVSDAGYRVLRAI